MTRVATIDDVVLATCRHMDVTLEELRGSGRHRRVVRARMVVAVVGRQMGASYPTIGAACRHNGAHTTMLDALQRGLVLMAADESFGRDVEAVSAAVARVGQWPTPKDKSGKVWKDSPPPQTGDLTPSQFGLLAAAFNHDGSVKVAGKQWLISDVLKARGLAVEVSGHIRITDQGRAYCEARRAVAST